MVVGALRVGMQGGERSFAMKVALALLTKLSLGYVLQGSGRVPGGFLDPFQH